MARADEYEDWSEFPDDDDEGDEAPGEDEQDRQDDALALLRKQQKAQKKVDKEEREALGTVVTEFLKDATPEQIELADIFLDGVVSASQARKAIDKITARAAKLNPDAHIAKGDDDDEDDGGKGSSFAPPMGGDISVPKTDDEKLTEKLKGGRVTMNDLMDSWDKTPTGQWSYNE